MPNNQAQTRNGGFKPELNKLFMIDIETTGVDPKTEHVMQIAMIEMIWENGQWTMGRTFNFFQHTSQQPTTKFHFEHMKEIFAKCNAAPLLPAAEVRQKILDFCKSCGSAPPNIFFAGWNAGIFDIPFLEYHGYLQPARYINDKLTGDCHYRIYDLSGALQLAANVKGHNEINAMIKEAQKTAPKHQYEGSRHDALYDCERQIHLLNGLLKILRP